MADAPAAGAAAGATTTTTTKDAGTTAPVVGASGGGGDALTAAVTKGVEVRPYKIHVPNKYLDQIKKKLELTRLPHEGSEPKSEDWWEPKPLVEPLIDFWLDKFNWRDQESALNSALPQFRTAITLPPLEAPIRIHFIHIRSAHLHAVPLLVIPPFPFTNLSLGHLVRPFTDPEDPAADQPFHVVIPSLPGLGFSDALPNNLAPVPAAAEVLNSLMARLSYPHYLASGTGPGHVSPAQIDWKLINRLATYYPTSCVGSHFISPLLEAPKINEAPWEWAKWNVANFFRAGILGYSDDDFEALDRVRRPLWEPKPSSTDSSSRKLIAAGNEQLDLREPNTLAYALCDSPAGILAFVLKSLRTLGPTEEATFSQEQIITLTNLAWLPGPEYAMRFWAHCATHAEVVEEKPKHAAPAKAKKDGSTGGGEVMKPSVAITVFMGGKGEATEDDVEAAAAAGPADTMPGDVMLTSIIGTHSHHGVPLSGGGGDGVAADDIGTTTAAAAVALTRKDRYVCPAWGNAHYNVVHTQRVGGRAGGLLAFERPGVIIDGVRGLVKAVLSAADSPLKKTAPTSTTTPATGSGGGGAGGGEVVPLEGVTVVPTTTAAPPPPQNSPATQNQPATTKSATTCTSPGADPLDPPARPKAPSQPVSSGRTVAFVTTPPENGTADGSGVNKTKVVDDDDDDDDQSTLKDHKETIGGLDKGKGRESDLLSPPQPVRDHSFGDGESPDTLVEKGSPSPGPSHHSGADSSSPSPMKMPNSSGR
ncbi:Alpha/Beta hydrolase protein [Apodospora peruviana]|uniref:Alpha/Beta hydrolase protein n=1 Tax=Apodospora peruviana TaxID=516989 RepID=A0AAE0II71_9PEZI|nr:Alpha/Beta hydrolase protein [Apodospora peruviana]